MGQGSKANIQNDRNNLKGLVRNFNMQYYKGIPLRQIDRGYGNMKARRYIINDTNQNCWIPLKHLELDGTIKLGENIDYVFVQNWRQLELSGFRIAFEPIPHEEDILPSRRQRYWETE